MPPGAARAVGSSRLRPFRRPSARSARRSSRWCRGRLSGRRRRSADAGVSIDQGEATPRARRRVARCGAGRRGPISVQCGEVRITVRLCAPAEPSSQRRGGPMMRGGLRHMPRACVREVCPVHGGARFAARMGARFLPRACVRDTWPAHACAIPGPRMRARYLARACAGKRVTPSDDHSSPSPAPRPAPSPRVCSPGLRPGAPRATCALAQGP